MPLYTIYKTTNLVNGKYYIGMHQTDNPNDDYFGSGIYLRRAINKYGKQNFIKEILHVYNNEWEMRLAERILVVPDHETNYNLVCGGEGMQGGKNHLRYGAVWTEEVKKKISKALKGRKTGPNPKKGSPGEKNPMYGKKRPDLALRNKLRAKKCPQAS